MSDKITIELGDKLIDADKGALVIPAIAAENQTMVRTVTHGAGSSGKHTAHTLSQIALSMFEDGELHAEEPGKDSRLFLKWRDERIKAEDGLIVAWTDDGIRAWFLGGADMRSLLKAAHRYCTRWIRLDV